MQNVQGCEHSRALLHRDLDFISGKFFTYEIPKEKHYLLKYFKNELQMQFLRYFMLVGDTRNFVDHTGYYCSRRLLCYFKNRYRRLTRVYDAAKRALTEEGMETVHLIESGKLRLTKLPKS